MTRDTMRARAGRGIAPLAATTLAALAMGCSGAGGPQDIAETDGIDDEELIAVPADEGGDDGEEPPELDGPDECVETHEMFREDVWSPFMSTQCFACHNPLGTAAHTDLVLQASDVPGYAEANLNTVRNVARLEIEGVSLLLLKPLGEVEHGGGQQIEVDDSRHQALRALVEHLDDGPIACADDTDVTEFFTGVQLLDAEQTLRRAAFSLASRHPTPAELFAVETAGETGLENSLLVMMTEPAFYARVVEIFNQTLHTDRYLRSGTAALDLLDAADYPNKDWYASLPDGQQNQARGRSNSALAREPLELIRWVVEHDRPFTDVVAGHYTVVNPYLAQVYGLDLAPFADLEDTRDWQAVQVGQVPHAGVLTTPAYLNRYPTTPTNRNRMRAQVTLDYFLATDVMTLGARPIDADSVSEHNPTMNNPECTSCHQILDPVAGAFQNWNDTGRYVPDGWYQDMLPPGLGDEVMPGEAWPTSVQWLGDRIAADDRFARAVVELVYEGLTGQAAAREPTDPTAVDYGADIRAFAVQDKVFKDIAQRFIDSGYDLRELLVGLVMSPYYRASNSDPLDEQRAFELDGIGAARLASPEQLHRRIAMATGYAWTDDEGKSWLPRNRPLHLMYGGIDSDAVTEDFDDANGVMLNIVQRMANEMGCLATAQDFARPAAERVLFPFVESTSLPGLDDAAIAENIAHLHEQILGEALEPGDPRLADTLALFLDVHADGMSGMTTGEYPSALIGACRATVDPLTGDALPLQIVEDPDYTVRAWMAVVTAMLGDFTFMYE